MQCSVSLLYLAVGENKVDFLKAHAPAIMRVIYLPGKLEGLRRGLPSHVIARIHIEYGITVLRSPCIDVGETSSSWVLVLACAATPVSERGDHSPKGSSNRHYCTRCTIHLHQDLGGVTGWLIICWPRRCHHRTLGSRPTYGRVGQRLWPSPTAPLINSDHPSQ